MERDFYASTLPKGAFFFVCLFLLNIAQNTLRGWLRCGFNTLKNNNNICRYIVRFPTLHTFTKPTLLSPFERILPFLLFFKSFVLRHCRASLAYYTVLFFFQLLILLLNTSSIVEHKTRTRQPFVFLVNSKKKIHKGFTFNIVLNERKAVSGIFLKNTNIYGFKTTHFCDLIFQLFYELIKEKINVICAWYLHIRILYTT